MEEKLTQDNGLVLVNYKEPLKKVKDGFGYVGAVMMTLDGELMQCHVCGRLYRDVSLHARQTHKMETIDYKDKFGLARTTALISEVERTTRKERTMRWWNGLTKAQQDEFRAKGRKNLQKWIAQRKKEGTYNLGRPIALETKNKRGTCPDQLVQKIKDVAEKLGHVPSKSEFIDECKSQRYVHLIYKTFGSWSVAVKRAGMTPRSRDEGHGSRHAFRSDDELLEYLTLFWKENDKVPTTTDCKRGFLPAVEVYIRRFGGLPAARELAGIHEQPPGRWGKKK